jgi:hypothetical protein
MALFHQVDTEHIDVFLHAAYRRVEEVTDHADGNYINESFGNHEPHARYPQLSFIITAHAIHVSSVRSNCFVYLALFGYISPRVLLYLAST